MIVLHTKIIKSDCWTRIFVLPSNIINHFVRLWALLAASFCIWSILYEVIQTNFWCFSWHYNPYNLMIILHTKIIKSDCWIRTFYLPSHIISYLVRLWALLAASFCIWSILYEVIQTDFWCFSWHYNPYNIIWWSYCTLKS